MTDDLVKQLRYIARVFSDYDEFGPSDIKTVILAANAAANRIENQAIMHALIRESITEASDPDFLFGAMDNVTDMDVTLDDYAAAASRAIRAAVLGQEAQP